MRNRGDVLDYIDIYTCTLQRPDGSFSACAGAFDENLDLTHAVLHGSFSRRFRSHARRKGVPFRDPLKPMFPALDQAITLPWLSVMLTMVLLNVERMWAIPL